MFKNSKEYMPTFLLIAINVAVYAFTSYLSGDVFETSQPVMDALGQTNFAVWNGEVWRLFTSLFVHANVLHIFGNMFFLLIFGLRAEDMFDLKEYLFIYFVSGLTGGVLTLIMWPPNTVSVGASGAIFGILGATIIYARRAIGQSIITALVFAFFLFVINIGPDVNFIDHLGGLLMGLSTGYLLAATRKQKTAYTYGYQYRV
jgi:rhomboid protease GluP